MLEEMNVLEKLQKKERSLLQSLRGAEQQLKYETSHMEQELLERTQTVRSLGDLIQKLRSEKSLSV